MIFPASELILNPDGSVYHLHLRPEQLADTIITVGDPDRVAQVSQHFDRVDIKVQKREFVTHTGELNGKRLTVISTGIGTDNIDIVFNELDALATIDLQKREPLSQARQLTFVRIGTSGALQADLPVDSFLASSLAIGLEGLLLFYGFSVADGAPVDLLPHLEAHLDRVGEAGKHFPIQPYLSRAAPDLLQLFSGDHIHQGITLTAAGFYAPQGRELRLKSKFNRTLINQLVAWRGPREERITNLEMETAGIYGLANLLGHRAISLNALLANRATGAFSKTPGQTVSRLIEWSLEKLGHS